VYLTFLYITVKFYHGFVSMSSFHTSAAHMDWVQFAPGMSGDSDGTFIHPTDDNYMYSFSDRHFCCEKLFCL